MTPICESWLLREPNREHQNVPMNVLLWVGTALGGAARDTGRARAARRPGPYSYELGARGGPCVVL